MGLFGTAHKASRVSAKDVTDMLEQYFKRRHLDLSGHQVDASEGIGWWITEGSAKVYIFLLEDETGMVIRITSPIAHFPDANREAFFQRLLEINRDLSGCCLAAFQEVVLVTAQRPTLGLNQEELNDLVWNVSFVADKLDDELGRDFNAKAYEEDPNC